MPQKPEGEVSGALPAGLDILWGRRGRGQRGPKPGLSVDAVVEAAVAIADSDGLEGVSMANVARRLGFTTMSLYRYVASKEELLQLMWNASAEGAETLLLEGKGWKARLRYWTVVQRQMLDRHPWVTQMPMAAPPIAPNSLAFIEKGLQAMDETAFSDAQKMKFLGLISSYSLSEARMAHDARRAAALAPASPTSYELLLRQLVDPDRYPRLYRLAWAPEAAAPPDETAAFLSGLECILDGIEAQMKNSKRKQAKEPARRPHR